MSTTSETAKFYAELARLLEERDAAYETRGTDPERWSKAKHAYAEFRSGIRLFAEDAAAKRAAEGGDGSAPDQAIVRPEPVSGGVSVSNVSERGN